MDSLVKHAHRVCGLQIGVGYKVDLPNHCALVALTQLRDGKFRGDSKFTTWFEGIVRRQCAKEVNEKAAAKKREVLVGLGTDVVAVEPPQEAKEKVAELRERLTGVEQELFDLKLHGYSNAEISEMVGKTEDSVKSLWKRIVAEMRHREGLDGDAPDEEK